MLKTLEHYSNLLHTVYTIVMKPVACYHCQYDPNQCQISQNLGDRRESSLDNSQETRSDFGYSSAVEISALQ